MINTCTCGSLQRLDPWYSFVSYQIRLKKAKKLLLSVPGVQVIAGTGERSCHRGYRSQMHTVSGQAGNIFSLDITFCSNPRDQVLILDKSSIDQSGCPGIVEHGLPVIRSRFQEVFNGGLEIGVFIRASREHPDIHGQPPVPAPRTKDNSHKPLAEVYLVMNRARGIRIRGLEELVQAKIARRRSFEKAVCHHDLRDNNLIIHALLNQP